MVDNTFYPLTRILFFIVTLLTLGGCGPLLQEQKPRFFWPPPPGEAKIEYLNFYYSDEDLLRGVDRRLEHAILGRRNPVRIVTRPYSVASDGKGRIFVGDFADKRVNILDRSSHSSRVLLTMEGAPQKVLVDNKGEIWALDGMKAIVYHFSADEKLIEELNVKEIGRAASLAVDSDRQRFYITDSQNHRINVYDYQGGLLSSFGTRGRGPGEFNHPADLDLDVAGNLYIVDSLNARIQVLSAEGVYIRSFGERGTRRGSFSAAKGIAVSPNDLVYVTDANQNKVVIFNTAGDFLLSLGGHYIFDGSNVQPGGLYFPVGIDSDSNDTIFIADHFNGIIHEFQYLTPEFLAENPIRAEQIYQPQPADFKHGGQEEDTGVPAPVEKSDQHAPAQQP